MEARDDRRLLNLQRQLARLTHQTELGPPLHHRCGTPLPATKTTNLPFEWTEVFGSERPSLDRLTHHVHILEMNGESYRLKCSRQSAASQVSDDPVDS